MEKFHESMSELNMTHFDRSTLKLTKQIGGGYTGDVYEGTMKLLDNTIGVVVKRLSSDNYDPHSDYTVYSDALDECKISSKFMDNPERLIQFYGYSTQESSSKTRIYLLMEKTNSEGDISKHIYKDIFWKRITKEEYENNYKITMMYHGPKYWDYIMDRKDKLHLMYEMSLAIQELHSHNIAHCDLKPHNMLFTDGKVKLIDFNASHNMGSQKTIEGSCEPGTPGYMAKEMYNGTISYKADIYSLGVCMLEVWFGDIWPSESSKYSKCRKYVLDYLYMIGKQEPKLHALIKKCVSSDVKSRPSIKKVVSNLKDILELQEISQLCDN